MLDEINKRWNPHHWHRALCGSGDGPLHSTCWWRPHSLAASPQGSQTAECRALWPHAASTCERRDRRSPHKSGLQSYKDTQATHSVPNGNACQHAVTRSNTSRRLTHRSQTQCRTGSTTGGVQKQPRHQRCPSAPLARARETPAGRAAPPPPCRSELQTQHSNH